MCFELGVGNFVLMLLVLGWTGPRVYVGIPRFGLRQVNMEDLGAAKLLALPLVKNPEILLGAYEGVRDALYPAKVARKT